MITIGFSTREHNQDYIDYIQKTVMYKEVEIIEKVNNGEKSLSQTYNEIIEESSNDIVVLLHDDLEFETKNWGDKLLKSFNKNPEFGIIGLAGTKFLPSSGRWWDVTENMFGIVNHKHEGKKWTSSYSKNLNQKVEETVIIDGLFIAFDKNKIKHRFDEEIEGFHFYDLGFTLPNHIDGVKVGVTTMVRVTHLSIGQTNQQWEDNRLKFVKKYKSHLPVDINPKGLSQTFIFCHDQDLIIGFEENKKFKNLYNYSYVFLGNGSVDKLSNLNNIIVARELEYNIEQYPLFTSYTGWYALWKNNLINSKYVNLFEYDVILDDHIDQRHSRLYEMGVECVGYNPFPMDNFHFNKNPEWVQHIIPAIKEVHKFDVNRYFNKVLSKNPNSVWSSTSNTTFRSDIFNEYMVWMEPLVDYIKETTTCGHAHERSITFFIKHKNKKQLITQKWLTHLQLDSHKTQGHKVNNEKSFEKLFTNQL